MDDTAALRRTIRRCTAALLIAIGLLVVNGGEYTDVSDWGYGLAALAGLYLVGSALAAVAAGGEPRHGDGATGNDGCGGRAGDRPNGDGGTDSGDGASDDAEDGDSGSPATGPADVGLGGPR